MKLNKKEAEVYIESVNKELHIKYGKKLFLKLDLVDVIYGYLNSIKEAAPKTQIKQVFKQGGVDLEILVNVEENEEIEVKK